MRATTFLCAIAILLDGSNGKPKHEALSDELVDYVNSQVDATWKAAKSERFKTLEEIRSVLGTMREDQNVKEFRRPTISHEDITLELPSEFDAREHWPECRTIPQIRDQSGCGSCWAFAAVTAMSDRVCIHSNQTLVNVQLSATDLLACCTTCGFGCVGGWGGMAWDYWRDNGIVTGGEYKDSHTCLPYPFPPCRHHGAKGSEYPPCPEKMYSTPQCVSECQKGYATKYEDDKIRASTSYNLYRSVTTIQKEIWMRGPVEATMNVYTDFANYAGGVYKHTTGELLGGHAIRLLGWGVEEDGTPYWLAANSWNPSWGEKGFFRILRGSDHCGIESDVSAGLPVNHESFS
ncbi:cathepsin B-like cysteine proteinase [Clonorchis sinensis]|uniref:Cathepsin B-like cysteine proteinase n=1 Tax=Clonorchis sinensis TaxID=79923 RepID=H2KPW2_CLOSI|nr:cathepsin B-like cysteine proteinase [Clonorchis sinensis]